MWGCFFQLKLGLEGCLVLFLWQVFFWCSGEGFFWVVEGFPVEMEVLYFGERFLKAGLFLRVKKRFNMLLHAGGAALL